MDPARAPTNVCLVPDLGHELLLVLDRLEALLLSLDAWEAEDEVGLPPPFADGQALHALRTVAEVVRPTQARGGPHILPGRLPRHGWTGRTLPIRFVPVPRTAPATLEQAAQTLAVQRAHPSLGAAVEQYAQVLGQEHLSVVRCLSRTVSLLTLPWDDDVTVLWASVNAYPDKCDVELSRSEQQAYDRVVGRIASLWSFRPHLDRRWVRGVGRFRTG